MAKGITPSSYIHYIEHSILTTPELSDWLYMSNISDFKLGDIVRVSFFRKLCKVVELGSNGRVLVSLLDSKEDTFSIDAKFVKPIEGDSGAAKVLFDT